MWELRHVLANPCFGVVVIALVFVALSVRPKRIAARQRAKPNPIWSLCAIPMCGLQIYFAFRSHDPGLMLMIGVAIVLEVYSLVKLESLSNEYDARVNYSQDAAHCGRCGYDLTGNTTGVCPECGWQLPKLPVKLQSPVWHVWWRDSSNIEYLERPERTFRSVTAAAIVSTIGIALTGALRLWGAMLALAAGAVFCWINVRRIGAYRKTLATKP